MFFYSTLRSYADPWIDNVVSAITKETRSEHHALSQRLDALERISTRDFSIADKALKQLDERLHNLETSSSPTLRTNLLQIVLRIEQKQEALAQDISALQARQAKIETDQTGRPCFEDEILQRVNKMAEQQLTSANEISILQQCVMQIDNNDKVTTLGRLEALEANAGMNKTTNEQGEHGALFQMQILKLVERGGDLDARVAALEGGLKNERLERENSKLKRKSFLSLPMKSA